MKTETIKKPMSLTTKISTGAALLVMSAGSFAADTGGAGSAIQAAVDSAKANMTVVTVGVLTVAAVGFGIGLVASFLRK